MTVLDYQRFLAFLAEYRPDVLEKYPQRRWENGYPIFIPNNETTPADQEEIDAIVESWKIQQLLR